MIAPVRYELPLSLFCIPIIKFYLFLVKYIYLFEIKTENIRAQRDKCTMICAGNTLANDKHLLIFLS